MYKLIFLYLAVYLGLGYVSSSVVLKLTKLYISSVWFDPVSILCTVILTMVFYFIYVGYQNEKNFCYLYLFICPFILLVFSELAIFIPELPTYMYEFFELAKQVNYYKNIYAVFVTLFIIQAFYRKK